MMQLLRLALLAIALSAGALIPAVVQAANCVAPGGLLDVPTRGFLRNEAPNLTLEFRDGSHAEVTLISITSSRIRILLPSTGLPGNEMFKVRHQPPTGPAKMIASGRICPTGPVDPVDPPGPVDPTDPTDPVDPTDPTDPVTKKKNPAAGAALARRAGRVPFERATSSDVAAPSGAPEYLLAGTSPEIARAEAVVARLGLRVLRRKDMNGLRLSLLALDLNGVVRPSQLRSALTRSGVKVVLDRHSVYRAAQASQGYAAAMVGLGSASACPLPSTVRIGLIDGPVDASNPALSGVPIRMTSVLGSREKQGSSDHATGLAALIAGQGGAPGAQLYSVVAFARNGGRDVARLENIAEAIDWLVRNNVNLVNLSLAGPKNETLAEVIRIADQKGIIMIAATGNNGQPEPAYPASDPRVIAITAVDSDSRPYRKANFGKAVDFAAPGVDVLVPGKRGASHRSGTSYASAIASAVVAQVMARGVRGRDPIIAALRKAATDLGPPGHDERFGWGLIRAPACR
jgi:hypothetical protein